MECRYSTYSYAMWQGQAQSKGSVKEAGKDAIAKKNVSGTFRLTPHHSDTRSALECQNGPDTCSYMSESGDKYAYPLPALSFDFSAGEKLKVTLTHATLNDIVLGIAAYNWCVLRSSPKVEQQPRANVHQVGSCFLSSHMMIAQVGPPAEQGLDPPAVQRRPLCCVRPSFTIAFLSEPSRG